MVTDPWETELRGLSFCPLTNKGLGMTDDVGITTTGEGVENTTVTQTDMGISTDKTFESTTIDKLTLGHIGTVASSIASHTGQLAVAVQVDIGAVLRIVVVFQLFGVVVVFLGPTNSSLLTTTKDLEDITLVQVDRSTTPDL